MKDLLCTNNYTGALYPLSQLILTAAYSCKHHDPTSVDEDTETMDA